MQVDLVLQGQGSWQPQICLHRARFRESPTTDETRRIPFWGKPFVRYEGERKDSPLLGDCGATAVMPM